MVELIVNMPLQCWEMTSVCCFLKMENPQSYEETVEVLMIELRKLCETKQREHSHISDNNKLTVKAEVINSLMDIELDAS